jgi:hypothetical protein
MSIAETAVVDVDIGACERLATLLRQKPIPADREETRLPGLSRVEIGNFYFLLVAICHQTSPMGRRPLQGTVRGTKRTGWDYLLAKLEDAVATSPELLERDSWARMTPLALTLLFRDAEVGDTLTDVPGRALLIRDLAAVMTRNQWSRLEDLFNQARGCVDTGPSSLFKLLSRFRAYDDPVRKKSSFLLALMRNNAIWVYRDGERLGPPVDYHEVRGHLRIGTVSVKDPVLLRKLLCHQPVTEKEDIAIRQAVYEAIMLISDRTSIHDPSRLHYLFWNVFRSCCKRESPHCDGCPPTCALPERYVPLAEYANGPRRCPFADVCASAHASVRLDEHIFETDHY